MARRRQNKKSVPELIIGVGIFIVAFGVINPKLREQMFSALTSMVSFALLVGIVGAVIYLFIQIKKVRSAPVFAPPPVPSTPTDNHHIDSLKAKFPNAFKHLQGDESVEQSQLSHSDIHKGSYFEELKAKFPTNPTHNWDVSILRDIEWKRFETVCTEYLKMTGYIAKETNVGADGGVDIRVCKPDIEGSDGIVQCKAWNTYKVGIKPIRELFGVMAAEHRTTGIFMTSGEFTSEAEDFAKDKIELIWGEKFVHLIKRLSDDDQTTLLNIALEGDYKTPTCPQCDIKMTLRESSKGRNAGGQFWGCVRYPRCKQTLIYKEA